MRLTFRDLMFGFISVVVAGSAGCGGGGSARTYPDPIVIDAGIPDASSVDEGADVALPPPMAGDNVVQLFKGTAQLLTHGAPCTSEIGVTTDRWCAFVSPSRSTIGADELFVVNVSKAASGTTVSCGAGLADPNCLKLTGGFFEEGSTPFPHAAGFRGDTLVYFDLTLTGFGWRPGMANGRVLATNSAGLLHDCLASGKGTSVLCRKDLLQPPVDGITQTELWVGKLDAAQDRDSPLEAVETVISADTALPSPVQQHFQVGFSPDGEYLAWSSVAQKGGVEILKAQRVGDASTRITVATDVARWAISPDGSRWYWLSHFNYDTTGMRAGELQTAPFPAGTAPTILLPGAADFTLTRTGGLVARANVTRGLGDLKAIPDPQTAPTAINSLDTGVIGYLSVGPKGHVVYTKNLEPTFSFVDLFVKNMDGAGSVCALTRKTDGQRSLFFLASGGALVWAQVSNLDSLTDTTFKYKEWFTRLSDCNSTLVASNIGSYGAAGDVGVLIEDDFDGVEGTLRVQSVTGGEVLGTQAPALIQTRVNNYVPVLVNPGVVLFTVSTDSTKDGLYLRPLEAGAGAGGDAGDAGDASADAAERYDSAANDGEVDGGAGPDAPG